MKPSNEEILKAENEQLQKRVAYLEGILNKIPVFIDIDQVDQMDGVDMVQNIWSNHPAGAPCLNNETEALHAELTKHAIEYFRDNSEKAIFSGIINVKPATGGCKWINIRSGVFKHKPDGTPWQLINAGFELSDQVHCTDKLVEVIKTLNRIKNQDKIKNISNREMEILLLVTRGLTDREIADTLYISDRTAQTHRNNLIKKTGNKNTASLVTFAVENGLH